MHGLRRVLGAERIVRKGSGYVIHVEPDELDVERFERHVRRECPESDADWGSVRAPAWRSLIRNAFMRRLLVAP